MTDSWTAGPSGAGAETGAEASHHPGPNVFLSFAPWIAIWVLSGNDSFRLATVVALIASAVLIGWEILSGVRPKSLDWGTFAVLAGLCVIGLVADPSWLAKWLNPIANGALFVIMAGTILLGHPFARAYGRDTVPREYWDTPVFRKATFGISIVWALAIGAMFVGSLITAVAPSTETWSTWVVTVGALLVAIKFQAWYPRQVRAAAGLPPDGAPPTAGPPAGG